MSIRESQIRATAKYCKQNYDRLEIKVYKGEKQPILDHCERMGESFNAFANRALKEQMARDAADLEAGECE